MNIFLLEMKIDERHLGKAARVVKVGLTNTEIHCVSNYFLGHLHTVATSNRVT
jgi:hypothetical protein